MDGQGNNIQFGRGMSPNGQNMPPVQQGIPNMQGMPNSQNMPNQQGMPVQQGMSNMQGMPNPQGMTNQMNYAGGQYPYQNQSIPMPARQPKPPMDPQKKKKIIVWSVVAGALVTLGIAAMIMIPILLRVDYRSAYLAAKELEPKIDAISNDYYCDYAEKYLSSAYTDSTDYDGYLSKCSSLFDDSLGELVEAVGNTESVKKDNKTLEQFNRVKSAYDVVQSGAVANLDNNFALWRIWHNFILGSSALRYGSSTDAEVASAANNLINSGNETLKTYGEGWLEKVMAAIVAYREREAAPLMKYSSFSEAYRIKKKEFDDWVAANEPDIKAMAPVDFSGTTDLVSEFERLNTMITDAYEEHYDESSDDCSVILGQPVCE